MGIGTLLLDRGLIDKQQLDEALAEQRQSGERLDRVMVRLGMATREQVMEAIGDQFHMPVVDMLNVKVEPDVLDVLPAKPERMDKLRAGMTRRLEALTPSFRQLQDKFLVVAVHLPTTRLMTIFGQVSGASGSKQICLVLGPEASKFVLFWDTLN